MFRLQRSKPLIREVEKGQVGANGASKTQNLPELECCAPGCVQLPDLGEVAGRVQNKRSEELGRWLGG